jgi:uncharacterized protein
MKTSSKYVSNRVLKLNVGFLLNDGPGHSHETIFDAPAVRISDDLELEYIRGPLRLSRTKEGILVQGQLHVGLETECSRCLDPVHNDFAVEIEELFSYPASTSSEFSIGDDAMLDLAPLLRDEALILASHGELCRPDCKGLCIDCGANLNHETCECALNNIDPRLAKLKELLNRQ